MRTIILSVLLTFCLTGYSQSGTGQQLADYKAYCNEIVADTIDQFGILTGSYRLIYRGTDTLGYTVDVTDTVWVQQQCPEFSNVSQAANQPRARWTTARKVVCQVPRQRFVANSEEFWAWLDANNRD